MFNSEVSARYTIALWSNQEQARRTATIVAPLQFNALGLCRKRWHQTYPQSTYTPIEILGHAIV